MNGDKQVLSTTPSIDDYNAFVIQTNEYETGLIKGVSTSQVLLVYNKTHTKKFIGSLNILYSSNNGKI
jgi:hypothetical protein